MTFPYTLFTFTLTSTKTMDYLTTITIILAQVRTVEVPTICAIPIGILALILFSRAKIVKW